MLVISSILYGGFGKVRLVEVFVLAIFSYSHYFLFLIQLWIGVFPQSVLSVPCCFVQFYDMRHFLDYKPELFGDHIKKMESPFCVCVGKIMIISRYLCP